MANNTKTNPMQIDSTGVLFAKGQPVAFNYILFTASADDDDVLLSDADGNKIWVNKAGDVSADGYTYESGITFVGNNGLTVTTLDGTSTLLIYA